MHFAIFSQLKKQSFNVQHLVIASLIALAIGFLSGRISLADHELTIDIPKNLVALKLEFPHAQNVQGKSFLARKSGCILSEKPMKAMSAGDATLLLIKALDAPKILESLAREDIAQLGLVAAAKTLPPPCNMLTRITYGAEDHE